MHNRRPCVKCRFMALIKAPFLQKTDLGSRKQRVHLLILGSLGMLAILLVMLLVLPFLWPSVPRWDQAQYFAGRPRPGANPPTQQGLCITRTTVGSSRDDVLWLRVGTHVWTLEVLSPMSRDR